MRQAGGIRRVLSDDDRDPCQRLRKRVSRRRHARGRWVSSTPTRPGAARSWIEASDRMPRRRRPGPLAPARPQPAVRRLVPAIEGQLRPRRASPDRGFPSTPEGSPTAPPHSSGTSPRRHAHPPPTHRRRGWEHPTMKGSPRFAPTVAQPPDKARCPPTAPRWLVSNWLWSMMGSVV